MAKPEGSSRTARTGQATEWVIVPVYWPTAAVVGTVTTRVGFQLQLSVAVAPEWEKALRAASRVTCSAAVVRLGVACVVARVGGDGSGPVGDVAGGNAAACGGQGGRGHRDVPL